MQSTLGGVHMTLLMVAGLRCRRAAPLAGLTFGPQHSGGNWCEDTCKSISELRDGSTLPGGTPRGCGSSTD